MKNCFQRTNLTLKQAETFVEETLDQAAESGAFDLAKLRIVLRKYPQLIEEDIVDVVLTMIPNHRRPLSLVKEVCNKFPNAGRVGEVHHILGWTPLHQLCAVKPSHEIVRYLLERDPEVTKIVTANGDTLLHLLCANQKASLKSIRYVMNKEPDMITSRNASGMLPIETLAARILENGSSISRVDIAIFKLLGKQHTWDTLKLAEICGLGDHNTLEVNGDVANLLFKYNNFRNLDASDCRFTTGGYLKLLHQCKTRNVQSLRLTVRNPMRRSRLWEALHIMLNNNKSLASLDLSLCGDHYCFDGTQKLNSFGKAFCSAVADSSTLKHLSMYLSPQFSLVGEHVRNMISRNTSIREFVFCNFAPVGQDIVQGLLQRKAPLNSLEMRNCVLQPVQLSFLAECLQGGGIKKLSFHERSLTSISGFAMEHTPEIEELSLKYPNCEAKNVLEGMVLPALETLNLKTLVIDAQKWTTEDITELARALRQSNLESLRFGRLSYEEKVSMDSIAKVLREHNVSLKELNIETRESFYMYPQFREIVHFCKVNAAGRALARRLSTKKEKIVEVLEGTQHDVSISYTLLREAPAMWSQ